VQNMHRSPASKKILFFDKIRLHFLKICFIILAMENLYKINGEKSLEIKAWAKINLTLDVLGKMPNGYHQLSTVMQKISLYDLLTISVQDTPKISITSNNSAIPTDESNLAYRAAERLISSYNIQKGIKIDIKKHIPISAGLAGGSADCAATLTGINKLFALKIPSEKLAEIGKSLGADVPFCLLNAGTALAEGIGEKLTALKSHPPVSIALAHLPVEVSTKDVFSRYFGRSEGQSPFMLKAITSGDIASIAENLANDLTEVTTALHPKILDLISAFREHRALGVNMSGSGPTVFAYFTSETHATMAIKIINKSFPECNFFCVRPKNLT